VGKSSILMQFAENKFTENYLTTIGVDFRYTISNIDSRLLISKIKRLNFKFGIQQGNRDFVPSLLHIIKELMEF